MFKLSSLAVAISFFSGLAFADDCIKLKAGTTVATLRSEAKADATGAGNLASGEFLSLVGSVPRWYKVRGAGQQLAFISKAVSEITECPSNLVARDATRAGRGDYELHAIDVGTGLSIFVRGEGFAILYDAGSRDDKRKGADNRVLNYLAALTPPVAKLQHAILSHPHEDHVELFGDVLNKFQVDEVWDSGAYYDSCAYRFFLQSAVTKSNRKYHNANFDEGVEKDVTFKKGNCYGKAVEKLPLKVKHASRIDTDAVIKLSDTATMRFLHADGSKHASYNDNSLVVRLELGNRVVLLMGDAEAGTGRPKPTKPNGRIVIPDEPGPTSIEGMLLAEPGIIKADVIVIGHHGSLTSSRPKFLDAVGATHYIVSSGPFPYSGVQLPDPEVIEMLKARGGSLLQTDFDDKECRLSSDKVGGKKDGSAGGCNNILMRIDQDGNIAMDYWVPGE